MDGIMKFKIVKIEYESGRVQYKVCKKSLLFWHDTLTTSSTRKQETVLCDCANMLKNNEVVTLCKFKDYQGRGTRGIEACVTVSSKSISTLDCFSVQAKDLQKIILRANARQLATIPTRKRIHNV